MERIVIIKSKVIHSRSVVSRWTLVMMICVLIREKEQVAAQEAVHAYKNIQTKLKKEQQDWSLRSIELSLKNYHKLKDHYSEIDWEIKEIEGTIFELQELTLESPM